MSCMRTGWLKYHPHWWERYGAVVVIGGDGHSNTFNLWNFHFLEADKLREKIDPVLFAQWFRQVCAVRRITALE